MASRPTGRRIAPEVRVSAVARAPIAQAGIARLAAAVVAAERAPVDALSITLVGPAHMRSLNRTHLGHDRVTDVIAFAFTSGPGRRSRLVGDVYICPTVAVAQARDFGTTPKEELRRLVVHGVLHVTGHDHPAGEARLTSPMWRRQERYLARFGSLAR